MPDPRHPRAATGRATAPAGRDRAADTRARLMDACLTTIRTQGMAKTSARSVAATADVNQALIFYHFGTLSGLVRAAFMDATGRRVAALEPSLAAVTTFEDLLGAAQGLHEAEDAEGNVTVLAQVLAGAQADPELAEAAGEALTLWSTPVRAAVDRVLADSALGDALDADTLTRMLTASFVGMELIGPTDPGLDPPVILRRLTPLARALDGLGPLARRAVRAGLRSRRGGSAR